jgi:hypothetical protein
MEFIFFSFIELLQLATKVNYISITISRSLKFTTARAEPFQLCSPVVGSNVIHFHAHHTLNTERSENAVTYVVSHY